MRRLRLSVPTVLMVLTVLLLTRVALAAPPALDARPALGDALVQGRWQPLIVTLQNPDTGEALQGEVQVTVEDLRTGESFGTYIRPVTLPRGAGTIQVPLLIRLPDGQQPDITVYVVSGRDGKGSVVTRKRFDKIPVRLDPLTVLTVSQQTDTLAYLQGEGIGVLYRGGVLQPASLSRQRNQPNRYESDTEQPVRVQQVSELARLPDRALGYDVVSLVYLASDTPPDAFSDSQVEALRRWVAGGGALVFQGDRLRSDERFRSWLPVPLPVGVDVSKFRAVPYGRGKLAVLGFDPTTPGFAESPEAIVAWKRVAKACSAPLSLGRTTVAPSYYYGSSFADAVLHAPGLRAPGIEYVGLFLVGYIVLLVPVNYLILRRMDRREWAWVTVPVLVLLFSGGAYLFGLATKGSQTIQNTATILEMNAGSGEALAHGVVGIFSPARARYRISVETPDAIFEDVSAGSRYRPSNGEYAPLVVSQRENRGAELRDAEISMWAMRTFSARTSTLKVGEGVACDLRWEGNRLVGTVENRTGKRLVNVHVFYAATALALPALEPGEKRNVSLVLPSGNSVGMPGGYNLYSGPDSRNAGLQENAPTPTVEAARVAIAQDIARFIESNNRFANQEFILDQQMGRDHALIVAWNHDALLPVLVNGQASPNGANANLLFIRAPVRHAERRVE